MSVDTDVSDHDRTIWARATSLQDVADRTARWLAGELASQPCYEPNAGPDEETTPLIPTLIRANRAGFLTTGSQPGHRPVIGFDGALWAQRPAVDGFIHPGPLLDELTARATAAGIIVTETGPTTLLSRLTNFTVPTPGVPVTTRAGQDCTWFGHRHNAYTRDPLCPRAAALDIDSSRFLSLVHPQFDDTDYLWTLIDSVCSATRSGHRQ